MKKLLSSLLGVSMLLGSFPSNTALASGNEGSNEDTTVYVTDENIDEVWDKFFDDEYSNYEFDFTEEAVDAFWETLYDEAVEYVENISDEEWAEIEREFYEEQYFWDNLSPETLLENYLYENPQMIGVSDRELAEIEDRILEVYEEISDSSQQTFVPFSRVYNFAGGPIAAWTANFSREDGLSRATIAIIMSEGSGASSRADRRYPNNTMRRDAYRHYVWNYLSVTNLLAGATLATRRANTRSVTTNRELASIMLRIPANANLNVTTINTVQQARGRQIRRGYLSMSRSAWHGLTNRNNNTRNDLMDLWNNHWGRVDGGGQPIAVPNLHAHFVARWNNTANTTGLQRTNVSMNETRRNHLWNNNWHRPR